MKVKKIPRTSPIWLRISHMSIIYSAQQYDTTDYNPKSYNIQEDRGIRGIVIDVGSFEGSSPNQVFLPIVTNKELARKIVYSRHTQKVPVPSAFKQTFNRSTTITQLQNLIQDGLQQMYLYLIAKP